jgi:hypothetical protein
MRKTTPVLAAVVLCGGSIFAGFVGAAGAKSKDGTVIEADVLVGVQAPYLRNANPIRGVNGGGLPWVIGRGEIELKASGKIEVEVRGLVIDPAATSAAAGTNPSPTFKAIVSCLSTTDGVVATTVNVETAQFPADAAGNSEFEDRVSLPSPCIAPIVFVTSGGGAWFAATGV